MAAHIAITEAKRELSDVAVKVLRRSVVMKRGMSEQIRAILDAVTNRVLAFRPKDKGLAAKKAARRVKRQAAKEGQDDRESS